MESRALMEPRNPMASFSGQAGRFPGQCQARNRQGTRCGNWAIRGAPTCRVHGSSTRLARRAAQLRVASLVDPAIAKLAAAVQAAINDPDFPPQLQVAAARDVLDRAGLKCPTELMVATEFDTHRFNDMTDEEIRTLVSLARKASGQAVPES
jgi:hypothetical protein